MGVRILLDGFSRWISPGSSIGSMKILADKRLTLSPDDLGIKVVGDRVSAPVKVVHFLNRIGVRDAAFIVPMMKDMPSLFVAELGIRADQFDKIRSTLEQELIHVSVQTTPFKTPPFGAMPVTPKKK